MISPISDVLLRTNKRRLHPGQDRRHNIPTREHDEVHEAWLLFGHLNSVSVAQERSWHTVILFYVTLFEEFFEKKVGPLSQAIELASWCTQIT